MPISRETTVQTPAPSLNAQAPVASLRSRSGRMVGWSYARVLEGRCYGCRFPVTKRFGVVAARRLYRGALQTTCARPLNVGAALLTSVLTIFWQPPPALRHPPSTGRVVPCLPGCAAHAAFVCLDKADFCQTGMIVFDARDVGHGNGLGTPVATRSPRVPGSPETERSQPHRKASGNPALETVSWRWDTPNHAHFLLARLNTAVFLGNGRSAAASSVAARDSFTIIGPYATPRITP